MSLNQDRIYQALQRALASGDARIYRVTTSQVAGQDTLLAKAQQSKGLTKNYILPQSWRVSYPADAVPEDSTPPWTVTLVGTVAYSATNSLLTIPVTSNVNGVCFSYDDEALTPAGTVLEVDVCIPMSEETLNRGLGLSISDGEKQFVTWLRWNGINIDGCVNAHCDLSRQRRVRFAAAELGCGVWIDGYLYQTGLYMNDTTTKQLCFGSYIP